MEIRVTKLTDENLLQRANSFTTGRDSHMSLERAYRYGHSPIRTQLFWIECREIPLFVASQIVRSHVGVQFFQRSKRPDRGGTDFALVCEQIAKGISYQKDWTPKWAERIKKLPKEFDRHAPTDIAFVINAEALINMAHKRLCIKASPETFAFMTRLVEDIAVIDPALARHLVPQCVFRGGICPEPKSCRWTTSADGKDALDDYRNLFID